MPPRGDPRLHADDILQAIANIEADRADLDFERFAADRRVRQLVERNLEIISEASRRLPEQAKARSPGSHDGRSPGSGTSCVMIMARYGRKSYGGSACIAPRLSRRLSAARC